MNKIQKPLVDNDYLLIAVGEKYTWTIAEIPDIPMPKTPFGMMKVKGRIDDYEFSEAHLMPQETVLWVCPYVLPYGRN